jgi:hypothetical protein
MWFSDIITDIAWLNAIEGKLGSPRSRAKQHVAEPDLDVEWLIYGDGRLIRHLRVLIHTDDYEQASACVNRNISFWVRSLEVASLVASPALCTVSLLQPNSTAYCVVLGQGDEYTGCSQLRVTVPEPPPTNYEDIAKLVVGWRPAFKTHLFFLSSFLNGALPPETRWHNGYRLLEWHFLRGQTGLAGNAAWRRFLDMHGTGFDPFLREGQTRHGLVEETRALVAHAMLQSRPDPEVDGATLNLITKTFKALECLVVQVINEGAVEGLLWRVNKGPKFSG